MRKTMTCAREECRFIFLCQKGAISMSMLLIVAGVMSVVLTAIMAMNLRLSADMSRSTTLFQFEVFRRNLAALILSDSSWNKIRLIPA